MLMGFRVSQAMGDMYSAERFPRLVRSLPLEGHKIVDFACGEHHVVALAADGSLFEWGDRSWLEPHKVLPPQIDDQDGPVKGWSRSCGRTSIASSRWRQAVSGSSLATVAEATSSALP